MFTNSNQAFSGCRLNDTDFNLSQESLESRKTAQLLQSVEKNEPELWAELRCSSRSGEDDGEGVDEQSEGPFDDKIALPDDVDVPVEALKAHMLGSEYATMYSAGYVEGGDGALTTIIDEEDLDQDWSDVDSVVDEGGSSYEDDNSDQEEPPVKRQRLLEF